MFNELKGEMGFAWIAEGLGVEGSILTGCKVQGSVCAFIGTSQMNHQPSIP